MIAPNHPRPKRNNGSHRSQEQLRRMLLLIDQLAPMRSFKTVHEINRMTVDRVGIDVCYRTTQRDLTLLESLGFVETISQPAAYGSVTILYRLNLRTTVGVQSAAMFLADCSEAA